MLETFLEHAPQRQGDDFQYKGMGMGISLIEMFVFVYGSGLKSSVKNTQHGLSVEEIRCLKTSSVQTKQQVER